MKRQVLSLASACALCIALSAPAFGGLITFQNFVGNVAVSTDGWGSTSQSGIVSAEVPAGSTVVAAYLYGAYFNFGSPFNPTATLDGNVVSFGPNVDNGTACCGIGSARADVTSIIKPSIDAGAGGVYDFRVTEGDDRQDGVALVVVYSNPSLPVSTVAILDGWASVLGDTTFANFASPLDPTAPGFFAEMRLGINFSCCGQQSTVTVNGTTITETAGNNDDGAAVANGSLITVGGFDDPFSPLLPSYGDDHERYNLVPYILAGDTQIRVDTFNSSQDDNIFLQVFHVAGIGRITTPNDPTVPEPSTYLMMSAGLIGLAALRRHRQR